MNVDDAERYPGRSSRGIVLIGLLRIIRLPWVGASSKDSTSDLVRGLLAGGDPLCLAIRDEADARREEAAAPLG